MWNMKRERGTRYSVITIIRPKSLLASKQLYNIQQYESSQDTCDSNDATPLKRQDLPSQLLHTDDEIVTGNMNLHAYHSTKQPRTHAPRNQQNEMRTLHFFVPEAAKQWTAHFACFDVQAGATRSCMTLKTAWMLEPVILRIKKITLQNICSCRVRGLSGSSCC